MSKRPWDDDKKKLHIYPPVEPPTDRMSLTWDALRPLCLVEPAVRHAVVLVERGDLTREQALIAVAYALYNQKAQLFAQLVERVNTEVPDFILLDDKRYDRRPPAAPWTRPNPEVAREVLGDLYASAAADPTAHGMTCPRCAFRAVDPSNYFGRERDGQRQCPACGHLFTVTTVE